MKTSLICLLLLAAVACAAPNAEMSEEMTEMRIETAEEREEMAAEKREEMAAERQEMAEEKREEIAEAAEAGLEAVDGEDRQIGIGISPCYGYCPSPFVLSCWFDVCVPIDFIYCDGFCCCCRVRFQYQCYN